MSYFHKHVTALGSIESLWYLKLASYKNFIKSFNEEFKEKITMNDSEKIEMQSACDARPNLFSKTVFHAVYIPENKDLPDEDKECIHIYEDMPSALKVIKIHKKARLKTFKNRSDAEAYARNGQDQSIDHSIYSSSVVQEKSSNFKAPEPQELVGFKKLIESGDLEAVKSIVWENPRYLISSGDTPAILHIGSRNNALHVAAKNDKPQMCEFILNIVGDPEFIQLHFGEIDKSNLDPAQIILDLYLNSPDKGLCETPLHYAAKYGYKDVVRVLVSYPQCIKTLKNKYEQMPIEIICTRRCTNNEDLKREIHMLLEDQFYVPVLRAEGNACPPLIGEPFSPTNPLNLNRDPMSPRVAVKAFAGPMNKSQAVEFRKKWKTPPRLTPKKGQGDTSIINSPSLILRLEDTEKGLERVGRELAEECQVPWKEYWPFLKDFVDFRNDEGLMKLEKYLKQIFENKNQNYSMQSINFAMQKLINNPNEDEPINCQQISEKINVDEMEVLSDKFQSLFVENDENEENIDTLEFFTPPSSPELFQNDSDDDMQNAEEGVTSFIEGFSPTKLDYAVYTALSTTICPNTYPNIYHWRHNMQLVMKRNPNRFNKNSLRRKLFHNN